LGKQGDENRTAGRTGQLDRPGRRLADQNGGEARPKKAGFLGGKRYWEIIGH
jgi:hypothetical protein